MDLPAAPVTAAEYAAAETAKTELKLPFYLSPGMITTDGGHSLRKLDTYWSKTQNCRKPVPIARCRLTGYEFMTDREPAADGSLVVRALSWPASPVCVYRNTWPWARKAFADADRQVPKDVSDREARVALQVHRALGVENTTGGLVLVKLTGLSWPSKLKLPEHII